jgi:hypothetical protein
MKPSFLNLFMKKLTREKAGAAIKLPLAELADSNEKVRSALNRATRNSGRRVATASDGNFLYVWNIAEKRHHLQFPASYLP